MTEDEQDTTSHWWGEFEFAVESAYWRVGPLELWANRGEHEFHLSWRSEKDPAHFEVLHQSPPSGAAPDDVQIQRFGFDRAPNVLELAPRLSDRPVVARPEEPFSILPKHEATVYISTPVWVGVRADDTDMLEIPSFRPTNTWFGDPDSHDGELCYSIQTRARMELGDMPSRVRAITRVALQNGGNDRLDVERIKLPMRFLSLLVDPSENLWTQPLTFKRESDGQLVGFRLEAPDSDVTELTSPRETAARGGILRAVNHLLR